MSVDTDEKFLNNPEDKKMDFTTTIKMALLKSFSTTLVGHKVRLSYGIRCIEQEWNIDENHYCDLISTDDGEDIYGIFNATSHDFIFGIYDDNETLIFIDEEQWDNLYMYNVADNDYRNLSL